MPEQRSFGIKGVCLRAQMKREVRCNTFCNSDNGRVVDDECIRARCIKCCNRFGQIFQIFITHKRIHGDVNLHAAFVRISNGLRNLFKRKIIRKVAQRECRLFRDTRRPRRIELRVTKRSQLPAGARSSIFLCLSAIFHLLFSLLKYKNNNEINHTFSLITERRK